MFWNTPVAQTLLEDYEIARISFLVYRTLLQEHLVNEIYAQS